MKRKARVSPMIRVNSKDENEVNTLSNDTLPQETNNFLSTTSIKDNSVEKLNGEKTTHKNEDSTKKRTRSTSSVRENISLLKKQAQQRWNKLKNTCRSKINLIKAYEDINYKLLHSNPFTEKKSRSLQCLLDSRETSRQKLGNKVTSKVLLNYFINLSHIEDSEEKLIDFEYLESLLNIGVDINVVDKHGQSILHEIARIWHTDVAEFVILHGANVDQPDNFGRTPLHVAAATDYTEMVKYLLEQGADIEARTYGEQQTPLHYAAKNDAVHSLRSLLANGADMNALDYKRRSPLHIAAELDRSLTAEELIDEGAPAGLYDDSMMTTLVLMIQKMPHVALHALDQFHVKNRANRRQFYYLNFLEPPIHEKACAAKTPLEVAVETNQHQLLLHPVFLRLVEVKWKQFGRRGVVFYNVINFLVCTFWTALMMLMPEDPKQRYYGNNMAIGLTLEIIAIITLVVLVASEGKDFFQARSKTKAYKRWRLKELERDLKFTHDRWPEEKSFLKREIEETREMTSSYIRDKWNYFDWITYVTMAATVFTGVLHRSVQTSVSQYTVRTTGSCMLVFMWIRMLKYARPYKMLGLFVVMLGHVAMDIVKMCFLIAHVFIPYAAAFWIIFGVYNVQGYRFVNGEIFFNIFQMSVIGDFEFENLAQHSQIMARVLSGTFIFMGGVVCLNLFIAMMSDTFQRVYDNAKANAVMQRAASIIELQSIFRYTTLKKYSEWIATHCAPESRYYDDDMTSPDQNLALKKITHAIHSHVFELQKKVDWLYDFSIESQEEKENLQSSLSLRQNNQGDGRYSQHNSRVSLNCENKKNSEDDLHELTVKISQLQSEHHRSIIQTRAEIAGLGMMIKELLEENDKRKTRRAKKLQSSNSSINSTSTVLSKHALHKLKKANKILKKKHQVEQVHVSRQTDETSGKSSPRDVISISQNNHIEKTFSKIQKEVKNKQTNTKQDSENIEKKQDGESIDDVFLRRQQLKMKREERKKKTTHKNILLPPLRMRHSEKVYVPNQEITDENILASVREKLQLLSRSQENINSDKNTAESVDRVNELNRNLTTRRNADEYIELSESVTHTSRGDHDATNETSSREEFQEETNINEATTIHARSFYNENTKNPEVTNSSKKNRFHSQNAIDIDEHSRNNTTHETNYVVQMNEQSTYFQPNLLQGNHHPQDNHRPHENHYSEGNPHLREMQHPPENPHQNVYHRPEEIPNEKENHRPQENHHTPENHHTHENHHPKENHRPQENHRSQENQHAQENYHPQTSDEHGTNVNAIENTQLDSNDGNQPPGEENTSNNGDTSDFFEGYTYTQDNQVSSTWQSIISRVTLQK